MPEREPLPPGILPNITDTDPPPLNPATVVGDGFVRVDETKLHPQADAALREPAAHPDHPEHRTWLEHSPHGRHPQQEATKHS